MGAISLRLPEELLEAAGDHARAMGISRAEYIRQAIERMNRQTRPQLRASRQAEASRRVREESTRAHAELEGMEFHPDAG
jgi:metal-responsive CopG/Arc/MetJ family transcriptional regulator